MDNAVVVEDVTFRYRGASQPALADVSVVIPVGQFVAVMGHAGSGKSSLCRCFNGLIPQFFRGALSGHVRVAGHEASSAPVAEFAGGVGMVFQNFESQLVASTVELEVAFGPENLAVPRSELRRRVDAYLRLTGLDGLRRRDPASLSGGQKQLLAIASVLALEPSVLVMDEPTTDLDARSQAEVLRIGRAATREDRTLVVVEHDAEVVQHADRLVIMRDGRIVADDRPAALLARVDLLASCGIRPLQLAQLFHRLGWTEFPLTVLDAVSALRGIRPVPVVSASPPLPARHRPVLRAASVSYTYREASAQALDRVDVTVGEGEFLGIIGPNGSGKTTLGKLLAGLLSPTQGRTEIAGEDARLMSRREVARLVGYVFQNPDLQIFTATVYDEVAFGPRSFGMSEPALGRCVARALHAVGLEGYETRDPLTLGRGERQRLAVASALATHPRVLILDEPTTGLDYPQQVRVMELLATLNRRGHTIVVITHSLWVLTEFAERTVVLRDGRIVLDGRTREVFQREDVLASAGLQAPPVVQVSNRLGLGAVTVKEMVRALEHVRGTPASTGQGVG